jgi:hypothetical protein
MITVLHGEATLGKRGTGTASRLSSWCDTLHRVSRRSFSEGGRPAPSNTPRSKPSAALILRQFGFVCVVKHPSGAVFQHLFPVLLPLFAKRTQLVFFLNLFIPRYFHIFQVGSFGKNTLFLESAVPTAI